MIIKKGGYTYREGPRDGTPPWDRAAKRRQGDRIMGPCRHGKPEGAWCETCSLYQVPLRQGEVMTDKPRETFTEMVRRLAQAGTTFWELIRWYWELKAERNRYKADLETATAEIRTLRDALKTAMDGGCYRAALVKLRKLIHHPNLQIGPVLCDRAISSVGLDPSEFDE